MKIQLVQLMFNPILGSGFGYPTPSLKVERRTSSSSSCSLRKANIMIGMPIGTLEPCHKTKGSIGKLWFVCSRIQNQNGKLGPLY